MAELVERPGLLLVVSFVGLLLAALLGVVSQKVWSPIRAGDQNELNIVQSAALTLLGLIVGFSFSMAVTRYDQRKNLEEAEANAIGTEYMRADLDARERGCGGARIAEAISGSAHPLLFDRPTRASSSESTRRRQSLAPISGPRRGPSPPRSRRP